MNNPLSIDNQFKRTNKLRHTALGEPSKYDQRRIPWKCRYLFQPICHSVNLLEKKCQNFTWGLGYDIPIGVLEKLLEQSDDDVTHIEILTKRNIGVGNPPFLNPVQ